MKLFRVTIQGTTALLMNKFTDEAMEAATRGTSNSTRNDEREPREIARTKLYTDPDEGFPVIPGANLLRCLIDAGTYFKIGMNKMTTQKSSIVPAAVAIQEDYIRVVHEEDWSADIRAVVIPKTGGRIACVRPRFDDWKLSSTIELDDDLVSSRRLRELVDAAGKRIGLGDFRPARKGPFGRFVVVEWNEE